jgi:hypothetical protein
MNAGSVSWLDWKLGARLLLKYPALTIIGGLSLAGAIAIGAVGIEVADELLYKRLKTSRRGQRFRRSVTSPSASGWTTRRRLASAVCLTMGRSARVARGHTKSSRAGCVRSLV